jgi:hypothetical protein
MPIPSEIENMPPAWTQQLSKFSDSNPAVPSLTVDPSLALAIDEGIAAKLSTARDNQEFIANPLRVESLLQDCINRISNCLTLREKAQDIEERAVSAALSYKLQQQSIVTQSGIALAFDEINSKMAKNAISASFDGRSVSFAGADEAWTNATSLRLQLEEAQRFKNETVRMKSTVPGNAANYVERFAFLKELFDLNLEEVYKRAQVVQSALQVIYQIPADLPVIEDVGYLNKLVIWAQRTSDLLDRELDRRSLGRIGITVSSGELDPNLTQQLMTKSAFLSKIDTGTLRFTLTEVPFYMAGMEPHSVLLRSARVQVAVQDLERVRPFPLVIKPPTSEVTGRSEQFPTIASTAYDDSPDSGGVVTGVHNINPVGNWEIHFSGFGLLGEPSNASQLLNVYLILDVSYRRR